MSPVSLRSNATYRSSFSEGLLGELGKTRLIKNTAKALRGKKKKIKLTANVDISVSVGIIKSLASLGACQIGVKGLFCSPRLLIHTAWAFSNTSRWPV